MSPKNTILEPTTFTAMNIKLAEIADGTIAFSQSLNVSSIRLDANTAEKGNANAYGSTNGRATYSAPHPRNKRNDEIAREV
jgi:hypothetical protein